MQMKPEAEVRYPLKPDSVEPGLGGKAARGAAWSMGFQVSRQLLSILSVSVLARRVPPEAYGLLSMAGIVTNFMDSFRALGTGNALIREGEVSERLLSSLFWFNLSLGVLLSACTALLAIPAAAFFRQPGLMKVMLALAPNFFIYSLSVIPNALLNRRMSFRALSVVQMAGAVLGTATGIGGALMGAGVWSLVFGALVSNLVISGATWIACPWRPQFLVDMGEVRRIAAYSLNLSGFNFVNFFSRNADNLVVGRLLGDTQLGFYQMAYMLMTSPLTNFCSVIAGVVFPALSTFQNDDARLRAAFLRVVMLIGLVTIPAMFGLSVVAGPFIEVVLGAKWHPVAGLLLVFAPLGAFQSIYTMVGPIYNAKGRADRLFQWSLISGSVYVASFLVGAHWGIQGVAIAYAIAWMAMMIPGLAIPFRLVNLPGREFVRALWPGFACSLVMAFVAGLWRCALYKLGIDSALIHLFSTAAVGGLCYAGLMLWWHPAAITELRAVPGASRLQSFLPRPRAGK